MFNGDLGVHDTAVEIKSGDFVLVQAITKREKPLFDFFVKRFERAAGQWWLASGDGLIPYLPMHHGIVARLVAVAQRQRDLPMRDQEQFEAIVAGSTPHYREHLKRMGAPALAAIKRDGLDRTTVFRDSTQC